MNNKLLFSTTLIITIASYLYLLGEIRTIQLIVEEILLIALLFPLLIFYFFFKSKLKGYDVEHLMNKQQLSFKTTLLFFLILQAFDYYYEDGFIGMMSQWFFYWILGLLSLLFIDTLHFYRIARLLR